MSACINISSENDLKHYMARKKTIVDHFQCTPVIHAKWRRVRNVVLMCVRLLRILNDVLLYGTSEKLLDIGKGINRVRDVMIPEAAK